MNVTLDDPFINRLAQVMVVIFIAIMVLPCVFAVYFYFNSSGFSTQPSEWARFVVTYLPRLSVFPADAFQVVANAVPIIVAQVCYRADNKSHLNRIGKTCLTFVLAGMLVGGVGLFLIDPQNERAVLNVVGGTQILTALKAVCEQGARSSVFYLSMFLGLQPKPKQGG